MKRYLVSTLFISGSMIAAHAMAYDLNDAANTLNSAANTVNAAQNTQNAIEGNNYRFTDVDRKDYNEYYNKQSKNKKNDDEDEDHNKQDHNSQGNNKKYSSLPPGLQKKVNNGGSLPPGWQKKVSNGQVFSPELRSYSKRSPYPSPKGTSTYIVEDKVVRVLDATNVIVDVLTH
jgi:hypothetical protein